MTPSSFDLKVSVSDGGSVTLTVLVTVAVLPANDNSPEFASDQLAAISLAENSPMGTLVATAAATDADKDDATSDHGTIVYSICEGVEAEGMEKYTGAQWASCIQFYFG